ncbi:GATA transcription factor 4 [Triticum aestivum]|uniref:GATA transcription factor 4 n=1 Tax=Triticum aestivum TaxID=4565 RepID=UPI000843EE6D|nr:GATA transcription factor 4-like [Triticum aestivum]
MVGGGDVDKHAAAALAQDLPSFNSFFDQTGLEVAAAAGDGELAAGAAAGEEDLEELEWLSNKDAFPSVETMAVEAVEEVPEPAPAAPSGRPAVGPRTKGRRRRVTAPWNLAEPPTLPPPLPAARRCTHCASEVTPQWRQGPLGPRTLCNACGVRYKTGRLLPEYRPANSPTFSPLLHSNSHRRVMQIRLRSESEGEGEGASPAVRAIAKARRAERAAARLAAKKDDGAPAPAPAQAALP